MFGELRKSNEYIVWADYSHLMLQQAVHRITAVLERDNCVFSRKYDKVLELNI